MNLINDRRERIRFLKFSFVGITGAIVDFGVMNLLRLALDLPLVWAQAISFVCAVINNFLWNRYWTYPESRNKVVTKQLIQFFMVNIIGILIRTPLVSWLDQIVVRSLGKLPIKIALADHIISQNLALATGILIVLLWNYFANRYWTYNDISDKKDVSTNESLLNQPDINFEKEDENE